MTEFEDLPMTIGEEDRPTRRAFLGGAVAAVGVGSQAKAKARGGSGRSEAARLFDRLTEAQREEICLPAGHPLRGRASRHWAVVRPTVGALGDAGRASCRAILERVCSSAGFAKIERLMEDDSGGIDSYHVAFFGEPEGPGVFEWLLTGRHLTIGADARAMEGGALAGPIFLGHDPKGGSVPGGVWDSLREAGSALLGRLSRRERFQARTASGASIGELGVDRREGVRALIEELLGTFREVDREAALGRIEESGGIDAHRLTDGGRAGDAWRIDGPALSWWFLARPHVHTEVRIDRGTPSA